MERIIYNNDVDVEEFKKNYPELEGDDVYDAIADDCYLSWEAEHANLNIELDTDVIAFASVGTWRGPRSGYKELSNNLNSIFNVFQSCDYIKVYGDGFNIRGRGIHHDGTNTVLFRRWKDNVSEAAKERVLQAVYNQRSEADALVKKYTLSLYRDVKKVYGW